jgi:hypothetical protein
MVGTVAGGDEDSLVDGPGNNRQRINAGGCREKNKQEMSSNGKAADNQRPL